MKRFDIKERGLQGFVRALKYFPWSILVGYEIEQNQDEVIISVPIALLKWPAQEQLGEYACKEMHKSEFTAFARQIDPSIKVECEHAPLILILRKGLQMAVHRVNGRMSPFMV